MTRYIQETPEKVAADQQKLAWLDELLKYEKFANEALAKKEFREASFYSTKLMEHCPDSIKHLSLKLESDISGNPNDMTDMIKFTTQVQERFIEFPAFLFWRGRVLLYNGQTDMGKKHIRQALSSDPDNKQIMRFWKNLQAMEKQKDQANEAQKNNDLV